MVKKEALQALRELKEGSAEKQKRAFEICRSVRLLLEAGADVHAKQQNPIAFGAINQAAYFGHHECIQVLLEFKADVNALDGHGGTPLVAAALNGEIECVRVLLAAQADVDKATKRGVLP
jgi:ankyrin repeat protein